MRFDAEFVLPNGCPIPAVAFGTWQLAPDEATAELVKEALTGGYSHVDTAAAYRNERQVGAGIRASGRRREDIYVTTKLPAEVKDPALVKEYFERSLKDLGLDYIDLYLIHAPWPWDEKGADYERENVLVWREMEKIYDSGKARAIGISNFSVANIENIEKNCRIRPMVNQIRYFIGNTEDDVVAACRARGIVVEAYSPLATGRLSDDPEIARLAAKYGRSWAQICLRYCLQNETLPLPKASSKARIAQNIDLDFDISAEDMSFLDRYNPLLKPRR